MSGGHFNYLFNTIEDTYKGELHDAQLEDLLVDFCKLLKALEWWQSCDTSEADYLKAVEAFKTKWLKNGALCEKCDYSRFSKKMVDIIVEIMIEAGFNNIEDFMKAIKERGKT